MRSWPGALVLLLVGAGGLHAQIEERSSLDRGVVEIQGMVVDRTTGDPVAGARVRLLAEDSEGEAVVGTGESGAFQFVGIPVGTFTLVIERIGYHVLDVPLSTEGGNFVEVDVALVPAAVELEPLVVTSARRDRLEWVGFRDRERNASGRFYTRRDLQRHRVTEISQLFRSIPGFRVIPSRDGRPASVVGRGNCLPTVYLDGVRVQNLAGQMDVLLVPDHLDGLEVYTSSQTPGQFQAGRCGTIVAWSQAPSANEGNPFQWRRLFAAGLLFSAVFTVMF